MTLELPASGGVFTVIFVNNAAAVVSWTADGDLELQQFQSTFTAPGPVVLYVAKAIASVSANTALGRQRQMATWITNQPVLLGMELLAGDQLTVNNLSAANAITYVQYKYL